ncbi:MFS transporter [Streptomyces cyaneofuscatus]|uniref:hypothetical protein n=1 Tax=Streptomyces cyaneofuscatus TaxID=66883 RepID=UPI003868C3D5|nr:MFS transporter [Streptomyces cyaneofuscatus]
MTSPPQVNGHQRPTSEPRFDPVVLAEADAIRAKAEADAEAARIKAKGEADAARTLAAEEAEKLRLTNERARLAQERKQVDHDAYVAKKAAETAKANAEKEKAEQANADREAAEARREAEQERSEHWWKWGARVIYAVGMVIAGPVQFMHFWDRDRPFLIAAPVLLEGFALVLAFGAAWAVANRRDVAPYRIGIMAGAVIAAVVNLHGGISDDRIGLNAGLIGAIASLGGPLVLMAYEHGKAQKADGIPSWRERRAVARAQAEAAAVRKKEQLERQAAEHAAEADRRLAESRAREEQERRDADRKSGHPKVWEVAEAIRSARGSQYVTEQIWTEAWGRVTGSKTVGITPEIEAQSRGAEARMQAATKTPVFGEFSLINSHRPLKPKKDPNAPDGRRGNGGVPPRRRAGDTQPPSPLARNQARIERTSTEEQK